MLIRIGSKAQITLFASTSSDSEKNHASNKENGRGVPNWHPFEGNRVENIRIKN